MRKLFIVTLFVCLGVVQTIAQSFTYTDANGKWTCTVLSAEEKTVSINRDFEPGQEVIIPSTVSDGTNEYMVTELYNNNYFFHYTDQDGNYRAYDVKKVTLPEHLQSIGSQLFYNCNQLLVVENTSHVKSVESSAFIGCSSLQTVDLPVCTSVGEYAFFNCSSLQTVDLPVCTSVEGRAFSSCSSLQSVELPVCTSVGAYAFESCSSLQSVDLPACTSVGSGAFYSCSSLQTVDLPVCTSVEERAFESCSSLQTVELPVCTSVEAYAFESCSSLQSVDLPVCTSVEERAFYCCSSLQSVDLPVCTSVGEQAFYCCSSLQSADLPVCTSVGAHAFQSCSSLQSIGLLVCTSVGSDAFQSCSSLQSVDLPVCVTVGDDAFSCCAKLSKVNWDCLEALGSCALSGTALYEISLPKTLKSLGYGCFNDNVVCMLNSEVPPAIAGRGTLGGFLFSTTSLIRVPESSLAAYRSADVWSKYKDKIISQSKRVDWDVQTQALETAAGLEKVVPTTDMANVVSLKVSGTINGYDIFMIRTKMYNLHYLDLTDAEFVANDKEYYTGCHTEDNTVGASAFRNLDNLLTLALPKNAKTIDSYAVDDCDNLQKVTLPEKLERIEYSAFSSCSRLADIQFPPCLKNINSYAFSYCNSLRKVMLPALESIGSWAFYGCSSLRELRVPSSLQSISDNAFDMCPLEKVYTYTVEPVNISQNTFSSSVYQTAELWMPTQSYANYFYNTEWGQFRSENYHWFDEPYEYFYVNKDYTLDKDNSADKDKGRFDGTPDVDINPGGGLIVNGDENQGADEIHLKGDGTNWASIIANANVDAKKLYIDITVRANRWYFFCFPFNIKRSNVSCGGSFVFRCYDGRIRAEQGHGGWVNVPNTEEYLQAGKGYIFQTSVEGTLSILVEREQFGKLPGVKVDCSLEANASTNEQDASWNFVGNPFTSFFNMEDMGYAAPVTRWNSETNTYEAVRPGDDDCIFHPFEAFFVQRPADSDNIAFPAEGRTTQIGAAKLAEANKAKRKQRRLNPERLLVNLTLSDGKTSDKTRVVYNPTRSNRYEMECDAAKFESGEATLQLYSIEAQAGRLAINERPAGSVRLGFTASKRGEYTLSATRMDQPVLLKDNVMNVTIDLSNGDYQFTTDAGTYDDRFMLLLDGSATGVADIARESGVNILPMEGGLNITGVNGARVNVYSLSGALYATRSDDGFLALSRGAYVVEVGKMKAKVMVR